MTFATTTQKITLVTLTPQCSKFLKSLLKILLFNKFLFKIFSNTVDDFDNYGYDGNNEDDFESRHKQFEDVRFIEFFKTCIRITNFIFLPCQQNCSRNTSSFLDLQNVYDNNFWNSGSNDFEFNFNSLNLKSSPFDLDPSSNGSDQMGETHNNNDPFINQNMMQDDGFSNIIGNLNYPLSSFLSNNCSTTTSNHQLHHLQESPSVMQDFSISCNNSVLYHINNSINNNLTIDQFKNDSNDNNWANFDIADNFADFDAHFSKSNLTSSVSNETSNTTVFNVNCNAENANATNAAAPEQPAIASENSNPNVPNFAIFSDPQPQAAVFPAFDDLEDEEFYSLRSENSEDISDIKSGDNEDTKECTSNAYLEDDDDFFASADER